MTAQLISDLRTYNLGEKFRIYIKQFHLMLLPLQMIECQAALGELPQAVFFENRKKC